MVRQHRQGSALCCLSIARVDYPRHALLVWPQVGPRSMVSKWCWCSPLLQPKHCTESMRPYRQQSTSRCVSLTHCDLMRWSWEYPLWGVWTLESVWLLISSSSVHNRDPASSCASDWPSRMHESPQCVREVKARRRSQWLLSWGFTQSDRPDFSPPPHPSDEPATADQTPSSLAAGTDPGRPLRLRFLLTQEDVAAADTFWFLFHKA